MDILHFVSTYWVESWAIFVVEIAFESFTVVVIEVELRSRVVVKSDHAGSAVVDSRNIARKTIDTNLETGNIVATRRDGVERPIFRRRLYFC